MLFMDTDTWSQSIKLCMTMAHTPWGGREGTLGVGERSGAEVLIENFDFPQIVCVLNEIWKGSLTSKTVPFG